MSRVNNVDTLEKQLSGLYMSSGNTKGKKTPPAVPPKKKAQPQVPQSTELNDSLHQPSYSSRISPNNNIRYASYTSPLTHSHKDYANMNLSTTRLPANYNTYSNVSYNYGDDLPPPPPPPPINLEDPKYDVTRNIDDYLPAPPSPVSSNYSELARATMNMNYNHNSSGYPHIYQNDYTLYGPTSSAANYESIYEPVDPRPHSRSSNEMQRNLPNNLNVNPPMPVRKSPLPKEAEVDALTEMLVKSISDSTEYDVFGVCIKCNGKVIGEASGCTAMDNMYHVKCFTCHRCGINLQGKPFYAVDGNPYCEPDYFETLEKCSVCMKPVLDRILRATGKPYHPACFICVVCGKSLDGIPFTVDAMNQIHCIEDFHKKFAPRCCVCEQPIMPEKGEEETVRVVALDRSFHVRCYRCEDCGLLLSSEAQGRGCYPLDNHILCKSCNAHRIRLLTNVMTTDL